MPAARKGPKGKAVFRPAPLPRSRKTAHAAPETDAKRMASSESRQPREQAEGGAQLDVAPAESLPEERGEQHGHAHAERAAQPRERGRKPWGEEGAAGQRREKDGDAVGDDPRVTVDHRRHEQRGEREAEQERLGGVPVAQVTEEPQQGVGGLHGGIPRRYPVPAAPAAAAQHKKAQQGDVVVPCDLLPAGGAEGAPLRDRDPKRDAVDADIQEAADHQPEQQGERGGQPFK